jgi:WD40 repeat protein
LRRHDYVSRVNLAYRECLDKNLTRALELLNGCTKDLRGWEWDYAWRQCHLDLATFYQSGQTLNGVAFSPDGTRVASVSGAFNSDRPFLIGDLVVRDVVTGREVFAQRDIARGCRGVAFSPDGRWIATGNASDLVIWDAATGKEEYRLPDPGNRNLPLLSLAYSPDGRRIIAGYGDFGGAVGHANLWDPKSRKLIERVPGDRGSVNGVAFSPDSREVGLASSKGFVELCEVEGPIRSNRVRPLRGHTDVVYAVAFSPDGRYLASGGMDRAIQLWDRDTGHEIQPLPGHESWVCGLAFSPDSRWLLSASEDRSLKLWEVASGRKLADFHGHQSYTSCVAFSPDGRLAASGGRDHAVKLWLTTWRAPLIFPGHDRAIRSLKFLPDSQRLVSGVGDGSTRCRLQMWDAMTGERLEPSFASCPEVYAIALHPEGRRLATAGPDGGEGVGTVRVWDLDTDQPVREQKGQTGEVTEVTYSLRVWDLETGQPVWKQKLDATEVTDLAYSPDGRWLAAAGVDERGSGGAVRLWDAETGREIRTFEKHTASAFGVAFSPDCRWLASGWGDRTVRIWDTRDPAGKARELPGHTGMVRRVKFLPDGRLASAGGSFLLSELGEVKIWDLSTGTVLHDLRGHSVAVFDLASSPDGQRLVTGSLDTTVKLWDTMTGEEVFTLRGHTAGVLSVAFSSDGRRIASGSIDRTVRVWDTSAPTAGARLRRQAESRIGVPELPADPFAR